MDILLLVRYYSFEQNQQLSGFLKQFDIKTGYTIFSEYEVENRLIDAKSLYSIYAYNSGRITSLLYGAVPSSLSISFENLKQKNKMVIPETIHKLKRLLDDGYLTGVNTIEPNVVTHEYNFSNVKEFSIKVISYVSNQK